MTFKEMIQATQAPAAPEDKTTEEPAPATAAPEDKTTEEPAPARSWSIPVYSYTPRAVVAGRNTLSSAANEAQKARIILE